MNKYERCYKCIHCKPCSAKGGLSQDGVECSHFKDKSLFVELPCKVWDTVYFIYETDNDTMFIDKGKIETFSIGDVNEGIWFMAIYENLSSYWHTSLSLGDTVFLTKEDAEAKLKELARGK